MLPEKYIQFNQSEWRLRIQEIWNFVHYLRLLNRNGVSLSNFKKTGFWFFCTSSKKEWIKQEIKNVHIGYSDEAVVIIAESYSEVPSYDPKPKIVFNFLFWYFIRKMTEICDEFESACGLHLTEQHVMDVIKNFKKKDKKVLNCNFV